MSTVVETVGWNLKIKYKDLNKRIGWELCPRCNFLLKDLIIEDLPVYLNAGLPPYFKHPKCAQFGYLYHNEQ